MISSFSGRVVRELDDLLERARRCPVHVLDRVVELLEDDRDLRKRVGARVLVDAVDHRGLGTRHVPRDDLVGQYHGLFDHVGRLGALAHDDLDRSGVVLGQLDLGLDRLEVETAARDTPLADRLGDSRELSEQSLRLRIRVRDPRRRACSGPRRSRSVRSERITDGKSS